MERQLSEEEQRFNEKISKILLRMGISPNLKGYRYIKQSILYILFDNSIVDNFSKRLYPILSKANNESEKSIERSIRHAIGISYSSARTIELNSILGVNCIEKNQKPTVRQLIIVLVEAIMLEKYAC